MSETDRQKQTAQQLEALLEQAVQGGFLRRVVLSKAHDAQIVRAELTVRAVGARLHWQLETFSTDHKARQYNYTAEQLTELLGQLLAQYRQLNVICTVGSCEWRQSKGGKQTLLGVAALLRAMSAPTEQKCAAPTAHNRQKQHILTGKEPFLRCLGVSDENGRVYDKKQSKFRQINRFLELLRDVEGHLPPDGVLGVCDLCCGKSYLSFAVYHYLSAVLNRQVVMTGVDLKSDVVEHCNAVARQLHFDGLQFVCGDVAAYEPPQGQPIHLVVSLHACDTATDLVLDKATAWQARVILSTPCCHHELNHTLDCPELACIASYSMLRQKLCDAATDAMRLLRLESCGYAVDAVELIDPEETPKNVMLRATRRQQVSSVQLQQKRREYENAVRFFVRTQGEAQRALLSRGNSGEPPDR